MLPPPEGLAPPPTGNPGSAPDKYSICTHKISFVIPYHIPKNWGKNAKATTRVTHYEPSYNSYHRLFPNLWHSENLSKKRQCADHFDKRHNKCSFTHSIIHNNRQFADSAYSGSSLCPSCSDHFDPNYYNVIPSLISDLFRIEIPTGNCSDLGRILSMEFPIREWGGWIRIF